MRRFYSHYVFIYPDIYLKNCVIELDILKNKITYYPFIQEIENTEFYSGWLFFVPDITIMNSLNPVSLDKYKDFGETKSGAIPMKDLYYCYNINKDVL